MADDVSLVRRCLASDESACREFVERFQGTVFGLCYRMLGHRQDAEDVAQDVFLRAFRSLHRWDSSRPLSPWLLTIAANRCRTALEKRSRLPVASACAADLAVDHGTVDSWESSDLAEELDLALRGLREEHRLCFVLFHQHQLSCLEIGEILNRPQGTIKTWLHRARRKLAEHLQSRGIVPGAPLALNRNGPQP